MSTRLTPRLKKPHQRRSLARTPRQRLLAAIRTHEEIANRHPPYTETHQYSTESIRKFKAELARRDARRHNPRRHRLSATPKWDRCVTDVTIRGRAVSPSAVCTAALRRKRAQVSKPPRKGTRTRALTSPRRRKNPRVSRVALYAHKRGHRILAYVGRGKFSDRGRPWLFDSRAAAAGALAVLRNTFPDALRTYRLTIR